MKISRIPSYQYIENDTIFHRLDPRAKIIGLFAVSILIMTFNDPRYAGTVFCLLILLTFLSKSYSVILSILPIFILIPTTMITLWTLFIKAGPTILSFGPITMTKNAVLYGFGSSLRVCSMIVWGLIFFTTTNLEKLSTGLVKLKIPFKLVFAFILALRFVPLFVSKGRTTIESQKSRGIDFETGNTIEKIKKRISLVVPLFTYILKNAKDLEMALYSKGFGAYSERTNYIKLKMEKKDYLFLFSISLLLIIGLYLRLNGYGTVVSRI